MKTGNLKIFLLIGVIALILAIVIAPANSVSAGPEERYDHPQDTSQRDCKDCHLKIKANWEVSPHAHAYDDPIFYNRYLDMGKPVECLVCHTTSYDPDTGEVIQPGVDCEACHGLAKPDHPQTANEIFADEYYCGSCHTTTLSEWRLTGHYRAGVGCMDCHDPHSQKNLFENPDDLCINCHKDDMGDYLEDLHIQNNIGCVDCHALVIPPDEIPLDGIVPTGHGFTITVPTCVACHTDKLHAGFSLPGYEYGAEDATVQGEFVSDIIDNAVDPLIDVIIDHEAEVLETANFTQTLMNLFQGAIIGLALGGSTAWFVAINFRARKEEDQNEVKED